MSSTTMTRTNGTGTGFHPWRGVRWAIAGYFAASVVFYLFRLWANTQSWNSDATWDSLQVALGLDAWATSHLVGVCGAVLGFFGGFLSMGIYHGGSVFRALWGALAGYALAVGTLMLIRQVSGMETFASVVDGELVMHAVRPSIVAGSIGSMFGFLWGIGSFTYWWDYISGKPTPEHEDHSGHGAKTWKDYFTFNTDHKVIGIQYIVTTFIFVIIGGLLAEMIRAELANPGLQYVKDGQGFNALFTVHAIVMIFGFIIPVFAGIANYVVPIMLGAPDMAFPRLNALSFWMLVVGGVMLLTSFLIGPFAAGWTNYAPLSTTGGTAGSVPLGATLFGVAVQVVGASSIMTAINFIVTIIAMRAPGLTMWRMPLLVWANFTTSLLVVFGTPFIAGSQFMVLYDQVMNMQFFTTLQGGDPIMYQHVFWFYSHPAVYIMMLPGFGIISEVITSHARKPIFGYKALALSTMGIGFLGFIVWAHHMFTSGMPGWFRFVMMFLTMLIAVPTGVKVLGWSATLWNSKIHMTTAMMFALGFLFTFTIGGLTGIMLASVPFDIFTTDSYFIVAHIHYVLFGGSVMTIFAGIYHWFPKITGRMYDEKLGKAHFWLAFMGMNITFFPMHWMGTLGLPRRVADYEALMNLHPNMHTWNFIATLGAMLQAVSFVIFFYNMINSWARGPKAPANPWGGKSLEWLVTSPPPLFNFHQTPQVIAGPYEFGVADGRHAVLDPTELKIPKPGAKKTAAATHKEGDE